MYFREEFLIKHFKFDIWKFLNCKFRETSKTWQKMKIECLVFKDIIEEIAGDYVKR